MLSMLFISFLPESFPVQYSSILAQLADFFHAGKKSLFKKSLPETQVPGRLLNLILNNS